MAVEHLRLGPFRGIQSTHMLRLGRINIVCGKNNSGKSSALGAIIAPSKTHVGFSLDDQNVETLANVTAKYLGIDLGKNTRQGDIFRQVISDEFKEGEVIFDGDEAHLLGRVQRELQESALRGQNINT